MLNLPCLRRLGPVFGTVLLSLSALTGSAVAKPQGAIRHITTIKLAVEGTKHYRVSLETENSRLVLRAADGPLAAFYLGKLRRRGDHFEAKLGKLGHASLRFENPSGHSRKLSDDLGRCGGARTIREVGAFRGSFVFNGERGYTRVSAPRVKGLLFHKSERVCDRPSDGRHRDAISSAFAVDSAGVTALSRAPGRVLVFEAFRFGGEEANWQISADQGERRYGLQIFRQAQLPLAHLDSAILSGAGEHPQTVSVAPANPFLGTATYTAAPTPGALPWDGSLKVPLPGAGIVSLAGRGFRAIACHSKSIHAFERCVNGGLGLKGPEIRARAIGAADRPVTSAGRS